MLDVNLGLLGQRFRVAGGARVEDFQQTVDSENPLIPSENVSSNIDNSDVLPSMNFTYLVTDNANIRLAYSKSVNRPEFREMSNVLYRDFNLDQNVIGNPNLRRAMVENYDVRLEIFPSVDEVLAVSYFHKGLTDAIEEQLVASPERFVRTWFNSEAGENYGFEIEARKSLGFILPLLKNFTASANYTKVTSKIEYKETKTDADGNANTEVKTRPMQGQSPWAVNASLLFEAPSFGMSVNLLYNRIGRRLDAIGDSRDEDVYEESRDLVDLVFAQKLFYNARLKFAISNLGDKDEIFTSGPDASLFAQINKGTTYSLSLSYRF
jgi:TonB-dependent receptor